MIFQSLLISHIAASMSSRDHLSCLEGQVAHNAGPREAVISAVMHNEACALLQPLRALREFKCHQGNAALLQTAVWSAATQAILQKMATRLSVRSCAMRRAPSWSHFWR